MSVVFLVLIIVSIVISLLTSGMFWAVSKFMVPPMIDAVPNLNWTGLAKSLVGLSDIVAQYPILLIVWPCIVLICGIFMRKNTEKGLKLAIVITILSGGFLLGVLFLATAGSHVMEEQMVAGMGLGV